MSREKDYFEDKLNIIIVGCGKIGTTLIDLLCSEGHNITIIDKHQERIQRVTDLYDILGIVGNGATYSTLHEAGIEDADLMISVTQSDELNLLCCTIAKQFGDCHTIARVRSPEYSQEVHYLKEKLGLDLIINPEGDAALEASRILYLPATLEENPFAHGQGTIINTKITKSNILNGLTIEEFGKKGPKDMLICMVERNGDVMIPTADLKMQENDVISFSCARDAAKNFLKYLGINTKRVADCLLIGGSRLSYYLAKQLLAMGVDVKIIERDRKRCEELAKELPKAIIINGDGTDRALLNEEGVKKVESFVSLIGIDEENILLTLFVKQISNAKVITKINRYQFPEVLNSLDLGSIINPREMAAESITAYVRALYNTKDSDIETLYHMYHHRVEAIEFRVREESVITNVPLSNMNLKKDLLIAFINRGDRIIIPKGSDEIHPGDTVVIITTTTGFKSIEDILR